MAETITTTGSWRQRHSHLTPSVILRAFRKETGVPTKDHIDFFPHLPGYTDPSSGLVAALPKCCIPYAQLMRLDRPAGFYAFYVPHLIGTMYAACIASMPPSPTQLIHFAAVLVPFNILLRGAACTWNDTVDQGFDRLVERCRHRPVARGAVSTTQANAFTLAQLTLGYYLIQLSFPPSCMVHIVPTVVLLFVYALMKRVTNYPQVVLGFPFAWALFLCVSALEADPQRRHIHASLALFGANVIWTIIYDTIYAHQDVADDVKAGVKSMAVRFRGTTKLLAIVLAVFQVLLLTTCGVWAGFSAVYFIGTVGGVGATMAIYIYNVDLRQPQSCAIWFQRQFWIVGTGFMLGFLGQYLRRLFREATPIQ